VCERCCVEEEVLCVPCRESSAGERALCFWRAPGGVRGGTPPGQLQFGQMILLRVVRSEGQRTGHGLV
jgi:hypothetical protein